MENGPHTPALPVKSAPPSQVSEPGSPLRGIVWNTHSRFPVRTSNASTSPFTFSLSVRPPGRNAGATITCREVQNTIHEERRRFAPEFTSAEIVGLPGPCDFQVLHIVAVDLIQRRIAGAAQFTTIGAPLSILCAVLSQRWEAANHKQDQQPNKDIAGESHHGSSKAMIDFAWIIREPGRRPHVFSATAGLLDLL